MDNTWVAIGNGAYVHQSKLVSMRERLRKALAIASPYKWSDVTQTSGHVVKVIRPTEQHDFKMGYVFTVTEVYASGKLSCNETIICFEKSELMIIGRKKVCGKYVS